MLNYYPFALKLKDERILIIGGGVIAERKIRVLLSANAKITVIAPRITEYLKELVNKSKIIWFRKSVDETDIYGRKIVIAATSDAGINRKISKWCREENIWVNVVDNSYLSNFISPAIINIGKALLAVYTDAKNPVYSRDLKNFLKENWSEFLSYRRRLQDS